MFYGKNLKCPKKFLIVKFKKKNFFEYSWEKMEEKKCTFSYLSIKLCRWVMIEKIWKKIVKQAIRWAVCQPVSFSIIISVFLSWMFSTFFLFNEKKVFFINYCLRKSFVQKIRDHIHHSPWSVCLSVCPETVKFGEAI